MIHCDKSRSYSIYILIYIEEILFSQRSLARFVLPTKLNVNELRTKAEWNQCQSIFSSKKIAHIQWTKADIMVCGSKMHDKIRERKKKKEKQQNTNIIIIYRTTCDSMNCNRFFNETKIDCYWLYYFCEEKKFLFSFHLASLATASYVLTVFGSNNSHFTKILLWLLSFLYLSRKKNEEINSWLNSTGAASAALA